MQLQWYFLILLVQWSSADFQQFPVEYSFAEKGDFNLLGSITIERNYDGNFTGTFVSKADSKKLWQEMRDAAKERNAYRIRSGINKEIVQTFSEPCLLLHSGLAHQFRVTVDPDQHSLLSLTVFPENLFSVGSDYQVCAHEDLPHFHRLSGSVVVTRVGTLPAPDTESYIQKMEKERQSRQHGAQQDNRSWLEKYWMYIAAAFIFMVVMNATAGDQGDQ